MVLQKISIAMDSVKQMARLKVKIQDLEYRFLLMDIGDFGRMEGAMRLSYELQRGKRSGETQGWISATDMERHFKDRCRV